jgi:dihydropteroate synthase
MGIVNLTLDSFFSNSRMLPKEKGDISLVIERIGAMIDDGADIIDFGAVSTRPGASPVDEKQEWERLSTVLKAARESFPKTTFSIDTTSSTIVRKAYEAIGPFIINDISAGEDDPKMLPLAGNLSLPYVAMHKRGNPQTMGSMTDYEDVTESVYSYFEDFSSKAELFGIKDWILDPGFGFCGGVDADYACLRQMDSLRAYNRDILVGVSRKSMLYKPLGLTPDECLIPTQALHLYALEHGATILRTHDVRDTYNIITLWSKIK